MKKFAGFTLTAVFLILLLTIAAMSLVRAHPVPYPPTTYIPFLTPRPCPTPSEFKEIDTGSGDGNVTSIGGVDSKNNVTAVGNTSTGPSVRLNEDSTWINLDVDFIPSGITWSGETESTIYISDNINNNIIFSPNIFSPSPDWLFMGGPGSEPGQFMNPNGMYSDYDGTLYVVDTGNNRVQFLNGYGWNILNGPSDSVYLVDICIFNGIIYLTDYMNNCIYFKGPSDIDWLKIVDETHLYYPSYIDVDSDGNLFVLSRVVYPDGFKKSIVRYEDGGFSVYVSSGNGPGLLSNSLDSEELCIDDHGNLIYADPIIGKIYAGLCDVNIIHTFNLNGVPIPVPISLKEVSMDVSSEVVSISIEPLKVCPFSTIIGDGSFPLAPGLNLFQVNCISESGIPSQYTVNINREEPEASSSPEPSPSQSPTPSPTPTATPTATPTPTPTATPAASPTPTPTPTTTPTPVPTPTASTAPPATPEPSPVGTPSPSATPPVTGYSPSPTAELTNSPESIMPSEAQSDSASQDADEDKVIADNSAKDDEILKQILIYGSISVVLIGAGIFTGILIGKKNRK